jgi:hypothetical protein
MGWYRSKKNQHKMKLESRPQNRKSPTCRQRSDIDPHSRLPGRFDGGAAGGAAPPPVDYFRDWDKNLALDIERMLTKYDGFSAYLAREFSPQKLTLGVLAQVFGAIGMDPSGQYLDPKVVEQLRHATKEGVKLCGSWLGTAKTQHKSEQIIDYATFRALFTRMHAKVANLMRSFFRDFERHS